MTFNNELSAHYHHIHTGLYTYMNKTHTTQTRTEHKQRLNVI